MKVIDAQVHLWKADSPERPWPKAGSLDPHLPEALGAERMLAMMDEAGVDAAIVVPPSWEGDRIDYALECAQRFPSRFAAMGRLALDDPKAREQLRTWRSQKGMLGVRLTFIVPRHMAQLENGSANWYWAAAEEYGIPTMVLAPERLSKISEVARRHSDLRLIVDHMGLSQRIAKEGRVAEAAEKVLSLADFPNVSIKLSGLADYSSEPYPFRDMHPYIKRTIETFGVKRCFWGADISRLLKRCSYRECVTFFDEALDFLNDRDRDSVMGRGLAESLGWREAMTSAEPN